MQKGKPYGPEESTSIQTRGGGYSKRSDRQSEFLVGGFSKSAAREY